MKKLLLTVTAILFAVISVNAQFSNSGNTSKSKTQSQTGEIVGRGEINAGVAIGKISQNGDKSEKSLYAPIVSLNYGAKFNDYFYLGAGAGFKYLTGKLTDNEYATLSLSASMIPVFAALRAFYPVSDDVAPFVMLDLGYSFCLSSKAKLTYNGYDPDPYYSRGSSQSLNAKLKGGLLLKVGAGIAFNKFTIGLGYEMQKIGSEYDELKDMSHNGFFINLGFVFND